MSKVRTHSTGMSTQYIDLTLYQLRTNKHLGNRRKYFESMVEFFLDVQDPTDLDELARRAGPNPYQDTIDRTSKLSGVNDRRTDKNGNDYWVEEESVMG